MAGATYIEILNAEPRSWPDRKLSGTTRTLLEGPHRKGKWGVHVVNLFLELECLLELLSS